MFYFRTCLADCVEVLIINVVVGDNLEVVGVILYRRFRHRGSKIQKSQLGIFFDDPHDFEGIVEAFINGGVCKETTKRGSETH